MAAANPLRDARDRFGRTPEDWLNEVLPFTAGPVLELTCDPSDSSSRITLRHLQSASTVLTQPDALPIDWDAVAGIRATLCLPIVNPLDGLLREIRRVMWPSGTLAALVPSRPGHSLAELRSWRPLNRVLAGGAGFRHASATDHLGWLLAAADFALLADQRQIFWMPIPDDPSARALVSGLAVAGIWPPNLTPDQLCRAGDTLARQAGPGRRLPIPLRLVVGRR
jgi:hypothetical protein